MSPLRNVNVSLPQFRDASGSLPLGGKANGCESQVRNAGAVTGHNSVLPMSMANCHDYVMPMCQYHNETMYMTNGHNYVHPHNYETSIVHWHNYVLFGDN